MSVHATAPLSAVSPRHLRPGDHDLTHLPWCDPERCITSAYGGIHLGPSNSSNHFHSTIADVEFGLTHYQDESKPKGYLLTLRRVATSGPIEVTVSDADLEQLAALHAWLRNDNGTDGEEAVEVDTRGDDSGAHAITE